MGRMLRGTIPLDDNGHPVSDFTVHMMVTDGPTLAEASDDIQYYLSVAPDGSWMIRKRTLSLGTERFAIGRSDFVSAWADRVSQTYDRTPAIF